MSSQRIVEGIFAINKPPSLSSAQVLRELQRVFNTSTLFAPWLAAQHAARDRESRFQHGRRKRKKMEVKMGHGGTLDPLATGVLIVGVGKGTKSLARFLECTKSYEAHVLFGATTDTYDISGKLLAKKPALQLTREDVEAELEAFRGEIRQRPPLYSALRVQGKRLYEYAREGKELPVEIKERTVKVEELRVLEWLQPGEHDFRWPVEEAAREEKEVAAKLLGTETKSESQDGETTEAPKRKRDADPEGGGDEAPSPSQGKVAKTEAPEVSDKDRAPSAPQDQGSAQSSTSPVPPPASGLPSAYPSANPPAEQPFRKGHHPGPALGALADAPAAKITMTVSSGFYVRSLCHDLGAAAGSLGLMASLVRTRQGAFELGTNVLEYDDLEKGEAVWGPKVRGMLEQWEEREKGEETEKEKETHGANVNE